MRLLASILGLLTLLATLGALTAPPPTQAATLNPSQLQIILQGGGGGVQCHNVRTFCRADVGRCESNERERQEWRSSCLVPHKRRYDECVRNFRSPLNNGYGAEHRRRSAQAACGHLANYAETKCQLEAQICPTTSQCESEYGQCIRNQAAALARETNRIQQPQPRPQLESDRNPPAQLSRPSSEPDTRYRVFVKNTCRKAIDIAYFYEEEAGQWAKAGWRKLQPGRTAELKSPIMTQRMGLYTSLGRSELKYRLGNQEYTTVVDRNFLVPRFERLREASARNVPFDMLQWASDIDRPFIAIENCDRFRSGKRIPKVPVLLTPIQSDRETEEPARVVEARPPASPRPIEEAQCMNIAQLPENERARFEALAEQQLVKLCEPD